MDDDGLTGRSAPTIPPASRVHSRGRTGRTERALVLVVDDYEDARLLYAEALAEAGFDVEHAANGDEAIAQAARVKPDVILMDMSMPGTDGWDATRRIRADEREHVAHIIAVTAVTGSESRTLAFDAGCDAFIAKPCTPDVLVAAVRAAVARPASA